MLCWHFAEICLQMKWGGAAEHRQRGMTHDTHFGLQNLQSSRPSGDRNLLIALITLSSHHTPSLCVLVRHEALSLLQFNAPVVTVNLLSEDTYR